jgi:hypothetical protein
MLAKPGGLTVNPCHEIIHTSGRQRCCAFLDVLFTVSKITEAETRGLCASLRLRR